MHSAGAVALLAEGVDRNTCEISVVLYLVYIKKLIRVRQESDALCNGAYKNVVIQNHQLVFERCSEKERVIVAINAADYPYTANAGELNGTAEKGHLF